MRFGILLRDQTYLALDRVRYVGEPVAGVAAVDLDTAMEALELIRVDCEPLPAHFDPLESMKEEAFLIHPEMGGYVCSEGFQPAPGTNKAYHFKVRTGDVDQGFQESDHVYEGTYRTPAVHHVYMEPNAHVAQYTRDGRLNLWADTQTTYLSRLKLSESLGLPMSKVRVQATYVGRRLRRKTLPGATRDRGPGHEGGRRAGQGPVHSGGILPGDIAPPSLHHHNPLRGQEGRHAGGPQVHGGDGHRRLQ